MAQISSNIGLVSGINYGQLISQLMGVESQPITLLQSRITSINAQKSAFSDLQTRLSSLQVTSQLLAKPSTIETPTATSSDPTTLTATAAAGTTPGSYQFQVAQMVSTQQLVTAGFSDQNQTPVGAASQTLSAGSGPLTRNPQLYQLNGGTGVGTGSFDITDSEGQKATFSVSGLASLQDVANLINSNTTISVHASIGSNGLVIKDLAGGSGAFSIADAQGNNAATLLGIAQSTSAGGTITGSDINYLGGATSIQDLNDGRGVRSSAGNDFQIVSSDGANFAVNLTTLNTVSDVLNAINNASGNNGKITASVSNNSDGIILTDNSGGTLTVSALNGSNAAADLGIAGSSTGNTLQGQAIMSPLNSVFISSLNGGSGLTLGAFTVSNANGPTTIDLTGSRTVQDMIDKINSAGAGVTASLNSNQNGLEITNNAGGALTITDADSNKIATQLGILANATSSTEVQGLNLGLATVSSGSITIEQGGSELSSPTPLSAMNGGKGVTLGQIRITDRTGKSEIVDLSSSLTLDDVVKKINTSLGLDVQASVTKNGLSLTDFSGGTGNFSVTDVGGGTTAKSLGIATSAANNTLTGSSIYYLGAATTLSQLNDGLGVRTNPQNNGDFRITFSDSSTVDVELNGTKTVGDVVNAINQAGAGKVSAQISGNSIQLNDTSGLGGTFSVSEIGSSNAAKDLGILSSGTGSISGAPVLGGVDTVKFSTLNGGAGLTTGSTTFTNRNGQSATIDFSNATTVQDVLDDINNATDGSGNSLNLVASLDPAGTGISLTDNSGGSGNLVIADATGTFASQLGIAGTYDTSVSAVNGANLKRQFINENTLLSNYNFGKGVNLGTFRLTDSQGISATINLASGKYNTLGDVMNAINSADSSDGKPLNITASINADGNGLLLTDNANGALKMTVADVTGTAAADLQIAGTAATDTIDGALAKTVTLTPQDTLSTVAQKINALNFGLRANVINDGSATSPYRLNLTAVNSGYEGRVTFDAGNTQLGASQLVAGQDAAVFVGSGGSTPLLISSRQNQITGIVPGLTVTLVGASSSPVTINVTNTSDQAVTQINNFVTAFNGLAAQITTYTAFDTSSDTGGVLLGDYNALDIQNLLYSNLNSVVPSTQQYHTLAQIGLTIDQQGNLDFDQDTFNQAYATNPDDVTKLLTATSTTANPDGTKTINPVGVMANLSTQLTSMLDPVGGLIAQENNTLDSKVTAFQNQITQLNTLIADKQNLLEQQFANLETTISTMQSQGQAIASLSGSSTSSTSKS